MVSAENETAPPGQEVLAGGFHESKQPWKANYESEGPMRIGPKKKNEMHSIQYYLTCSAKFMYFFTYKCSLE